MSPVARKLVTAEDLLATRDTGVCRELVRGEVIETTPSGIEHSEVGLGLGALLRAFVKGHNLGVVVGSDGGFMLERDPDTVRVPDCAFIARERLPEGRRPKGFFQGAPDLAVEVASPSDTWAGIEVKVREYLEAGTRLVWVVSPEARSVRVYRSAEKSFLLTEDGTLTGDPVLPGLAIPVREVFEE